MILRISEPGVKRLSNMSTSNRELGIAVWSFTLSARSLLSAQKCAAAC